MNIEGKRIINKKHDIHVHKCTFSHANFSSFGPQKYKLKNQSQPNVKVQLTIHSLKISVVPPRSLGLIMLEILSKLYQNHVL
jgi:hypothetical protein